MHGPLAGYGAGPLVPGDGASEQLNIPTRCMVYLTLTSRCLVLGFLSH